MTKVLAGMALVVALGCSSQDVPQAHRGQLFDRTGGLAMWAGGAGLSGPILGPGTYWTGLYDEIRMVNCAISTVKEPMTALTKDNVQFHMDIYVRYSADCSDEAVTKLLKIATVDNTLTVPPQFLYETYLRPSLGEAVRETVSPLRANDINDQREGILASIRKSFLTMMTAKEPKVLVIHEVNLSNMMPPEALMNANVERATQAVLKDKAIAERERVTAETETMEMRKKLAATEGAVQAAKIDQIGAALKRNPEYLQFDLQTKMPDIYKEAGEKGNLILAGPNPQVLIAPKR